MREFVSLLQPLHAPVLADDQPPAPAGTSDAPQAGVPDAAAARAADTGAGPAAGAQDGDGATQELFNFVSLNEGHTSPSPEIVFVHGGRPWIIFNLAKYADHHYEQISHRANFDHMDVSDNLGWATDYVSMHPGHEASDLARAMTIARQDSLLLSMPRELSFLNQMTFWGTIALLLASVLLLVVGKREASDLKPKNKLQLIIEMMVLFVRDNIVRPNMKHGDAWTPYFAALFMGILAMNIFGMFPFFATPTGNLAVTLAFALPTLLLMLVLGIRNNGAAHFWVALVPVKWSWKPLDMFVFMLLLPLELLSLFTRPAVLGLRLFANMFAGHTMMLVFLSLGFIIHENHGSGGLAWSLGGIGWLLAIPLYVLELAVALIQAYIFTLLSVIFINLCAHPEH